MYIKFVWEQISHSSSDEFWSIAYMLSSSSIRGFNFETINPGSSLLIVPKPLLISITIALV